LIIKKLRSIESLKGRQIGGSDGGNHGNSCLVDEDERAASSGTLLNFYQKTAIFPKYDIENDN
jgi:hypothetical protein